MKKKEYLGGENCSCSHDTTTTGIAPACGSRKNSRVSLFWQAHHWFWYEPICVFFKEGTYGPATLFPQAFKVWNEQLYALIGNVAAHHKPDMVFHLQNLHTHCADVMLLDRSQAEILPL